ncbi:MAG: transposase [Deltaproteobacteria bacterium]|nr:transposase [Deltaproteobacteria bacterium]
MPARKGSRKRERRQYSEDEKTRAVADVPELGLCAAARKHGIPNSTLHKWVGAKGGGGAAEPRAPESPGHEGSPRAGGPAVRYTPSQKAEYLEYAAKHGVTKAWKKHGVSRFTLYDWRRKVRLAAEGKGPSPTSGPAPQDIEALRDKEILNEWHRHPGWKRQATDRRR